MITSITCLLNDHRYAVTYDSSRYNAFGERCTLCYNPPIGVLYSKRQKRQISLSTLEETGVRGRHRRRIERLQPGHLERRSDEWEHLRTPHSLTGDVTTKEMTDLLYNGATAADLETLDAHTQETTPVEYPGLEFAVDVTELVGAAHSVEVRYEHAPDATAPDARHMGIVLDGVLHTGESFDAHTEHFGFARHHWSLGAADASRLVVGHAFAEGDYVANVAVWLHDADGLLMQHEETVRSAYAQDEFGRNHHSVAVARGGHLLAVGAPSYDNQAAPAPHSTANGDNHGVVQFFEYRVSEEACTTNQYHPPVYSDMTSYSGSTTGSFTRAQLSNWAGFQPSEDWAIFFELRKPTSDISLVTLHDGQNQGNAAFCRPGVIKYSASRNRIDFSWYPSQTALFFDGPILNADEYVQVLLSYNKLGYGSGGSEPNAASSAGDAGFSYYYRQSSTGTFSGDWTFATPSGLHDNFDHSETPASDYTTFFGRNYDSTTGLDGNGYLTNIKLWNNAMTPSDMAPAPACDRSGRFVANPLLQLSGAHPDGATGS